MSFKPTFGTASAPSHERSVQSHPVALVAFVVLSGVSAMADDGRPLSDAKDRTVRVWAAPDRVQGTLTAYDDETISVRLRDGQLRSFDRAAIQKMEIKGRGARFYVGLAAAGALSGAFLGYSVTTVNVCSFNAATCPAQTDAAVVWGVAALGALATVLPVRLHKGWGDGVEVRHRTSAVLVPVRHGVGVMVRVGF